MKRSLIFRSVIPRTRSCNAGPTVHDENTHRFFLKKMKKFVSFQGTVVSPSVLLLRDISGRS